MGWGAREPDLHFWKVHIGYLTLLLSVETGAGPHPAYCPMGAGLNKEARRYKLRSLRKYILFSQPTPQLLLSEKRDIIRCPWSGDARRPTGDTCFYVTRNEIKSVERNITPLQNKHSLVNANSICLQLSQTLVASSRASWPKQYSFWLVLAKWSARISAGTLTVLTGYFRGFPQSL